MNEIYTIFKSLLLPYHNIDIVFNKSKFSHTIFSTHKSRAYSHYGFVFVGKQTKYKCYCSHIYIHYVGWSVFIIRESGANFSRIVIGMRMRCTAYESVSECAFMPLPQLPWLLCVSFSTGPLFLIVLCMCCVWGGCLLVFFALLNLKWPSVKPTFSNHVSTIHKDILYASIRV